MIHFVILTLRANDLVVDTIWSRRLIVIRHMIGNFVPLLIVKGIYACLIPIVCGTILG